jgi:hypothetical protein
MRKAGVGALGVTLVSVGLMATPAFATRSVTRFRNKDAITFVTNCNFDKVGSTCLVYGIFAAQQRVNSDGSVSKSASLELDKYRLKILDAFGGVRVTFLATALAQNVSLAIPDDLSRATASGAVPNLVGPKIPVSFSLTANSPSVTTQGRQVVKVGGCTEFIDRTNAKSRFAAGTARIGGRAFSTSDTLTLTGAPRSEIDTSAETTIINDCTN